MTSRPGLPSRRQLVDIPSSSHPLPAQHQTPTREVGAAGHIGGA